MHLPPLPAFFDPRLMWATGLLAGALLAGAAAIALARRWSRAGGAAPDAGSELSRYRALYEKGQISQEEYARLRDVLRGQLRAATGTVKPQPPPPAAADPPSEGIRPS